VDSGSSLILKIKKDLITKDTALNQLFSQLSWRARQTTAVPVPGTPKSAKTNDRRTQNAVAIQTASQISALMDNLYWSARIFSSIRFEGASRS